MTRRRRPSSTLLFSVSGLVSLLIAGHELSYVSWRRAAAPVDGPLVIRKDAKGDGRFQAPRSGNRRHRGIDLAAALGSPVRAFRSGRVSHVGTHKGFGRFVELTHSSGVRSLYAHLQDVAVKDHQRIRQGDLIGTVGKTGNARHPSITPHVHFEVLRDGTPVDPAKMGLALQGHLHESVMPADDSPFEETDAAGGD